MPLKYLIDEHLRGKFTQALVATAFAEGIAADVVAVGDANAPPLGASDREIIRWGQEQGRILISLDKRTIPEALFVHLAAGGASPGVLLLRPMHSWEEVLHYLVSFAEVALPEECANRCVYIPL